MTVAINTLTIRGFRALRDVTLEGLGRVNLITGKNNTGKSSVLEALRILVSDAAHGVIWRILSEREEDRAESDDSNGLSEVDRLIPITCLFSGFPILSDTRSSIELTADDAARPMRIVLGIEWFSQQKGPGGSIKLTQPGPGLFEDEENDRIPCLVADTPRGKRLVRLRRFGTRDSIYPHDEPDESRLACVYVGPYGGERTTRLGALWDRIALSDMEDEVVRALRIIDPDISGVSMIGGERPGMSRLAIVRSKRFQRPVPLRSFGDGLNRLFGIVLSLVAAKGGVLLIDEFENGMHHTVQLDTWRTIFSMAERLNVQVFATSHSWSCIEAFQKAAAETPEDGVLVRLARRNDQILTTTFRENDLEVVTAEGIEVR